MLHIRKTSSILTRVYYSRLFKCLTSLISRNYVQRVQTTKIDFTNIRPSMVAEKKTQISLNDCFSDVQEFANSNLRAAAKKMRQEIKKIRRIEVGPHASVFFENYDTMWVQVHEMLCIEQSKEENIPEELDAYNPLVPNGKSLSATVMFEINNPKKRTEFLYQVGHIEDQIVLEFDNYQIKGIPISSDRTSPDGKTSAVHFIRFDFTDEQITAFKKLPSVTFSFKHPNYNHSTVLNKDTVADLATDFE